MTALAADTARVRYGEPLPLQEVKLGASKTVYAGSLVCINTATGYGEAGSTATTLKAVGVATRGGANGAVAGALTIPVETGDFEFTNSTSTDTLTQADVGNLVYIADDDTVAKLSTGRSAAGILVGFTSVMGSSVSKPLVRVGLGLGST